MRALLTELRRRRVFRTAALYIVGAWALLQAADILFPAWGIADAAINYLLVAAIVGFPVALVFGWLFDVGSDGIRRTRPASADELAAAAPLRRSDYVVLGAFVAVAALVLYSTAVRIIEAPLEQPNFASAAEKLDNSIAVLPFDNLSGDPENAYFAEGISEEILNRLGEFRNLHVIGRTSSFAFKDSGYDIARLSDLLGVRYLLQGSVRKEAEQVRISAQLLDDGGRQLWSQAYDRELRGIFDIQRDVAETVAASIAPRFALTPPLSDAPPNIEAYQHYLIGREILHKRAGSWVFDAAEQFERAIDIDPRYAEAYAELAILATYTAIYGIGDSDDRQRHLKRARQAIDKALALKPDLARAYAAQGLLLEQTEGPAAAEAPLRRALALDPNMTDASNWLGGALRALGRGAEGYAVMERAARIDPLAVPLNNNVAMARASRGDFAAAERILRRLVEVPQPAWPSYQMLVDFYFNTGEFVEQHEAAKLHALELTRSTGFSLTDQLARTYACLGLWERAKYWYARFAVPEVWHMPLRRFELLRRQGRWREAADLYRETFESQNVKLATAPGWAVAQYGLAHALAGDVEEAVATLESGLDLGQSIGAVGTDEVDARQALAWIHRESGANDQARPILEAIETHFSLMRANGELHISGDRLLFAQNAAVAGKHVLALARLEQAIEAGWRDYYRLLHDRRWDPVRDEPRYQDLMARVKADVDAQQARVEQIDAEDDFIARFDRILAADTKGD